jgi:DUF971 family protein
MLRVQNIAQTGERTLNVVWSDGRVQDIDVVSLRRACPCATCVDEWTKEKTLDPQSVAESTRPVEIESVGRYAMKASFSDGHKTGIYTFDMLRKLS